MESKDGKIDKRFLRRCTEPVIRHPSALVVWLDGKLLTVGVGWSHERSHEPPRPGALGVFLANLRLICTPQSGKSGISCIGLQQLKIRSESRREGLRHGQYKCSIIGGITWGERSGMFKCQSEEVD